MTRSFTEKPLLDRLGDLAKLFLKLGVIGFGGPNAHIAMMEDEVVQRRQWLTRESFLDLLGATNLIPGPNSTEMAIHIGYLYASWLGLIVAGISFILPAVLITTGFAWVYVAFGTLPQVAFLLYGIKPAVLAIVLDSTWRLGQKAVKTRKLLIIAIVVSILVWFARLNEILALLLGGVVGLVWLQLPNQKDSSEDQASLWIAGLTLFTALEANAVVGIAVASEVSVWQLGKVFLKIGSVLFGGGYVLVSLVQSELVEGYRWLTQQQLLDAIAVGQFTPGPILSTATFIGYVLAGVPGAIAATVGIFLPSFLLVVLLNPLIPYLRRSKWTASFLDAVNVSAVALMAIVTLHLAISTLGTAKAPFVDIVAVAISLVSAVLAIQFRVNAAWLVLGGAVIGWVASSFGYAR
ncbi:MAG: chromate efflux transporter [Plectolyngbya sp. WJT66-NPBG17]|jgi:chromate transporter|nr:chromate efflux transporter [Plectolyngbya sp. WJT66-NPBG17]